MLEEVPGAKGTLALMEASGGAPSGHFVLSSASIAISMCSAPCCSSRPSARKRRAQPRRACSIFAGQRRGSVASPTLRSEA